MAELPAVLKIMQAEPTRIWFIAELAAQVKSNNLGRDLAAYADRKVLERVPAPTAKHPRRMGWRWSKLPHTFRLPQALKPVLPGSPHGIVMQVFEANPTAWITNLDIVAFYPGRSVVSNMPDLFTAGCLERRKNDDGVYEYRLVRLSNRSGRGLSRVKKPKVVKPTPCPAARSRPMKETPKSVKPARPMPDLEQVRREEAKAAQLEAARAAHFAKTHALRTAAQQQIVAYLDGKQEPETATQIKDALGLTLGVQKVAIVALMHAGVVAEIPGSTVAYRLLKPEFPEVPAAMNRAAERVYGLLLGRADTELGLMQLTGWQRPEVRAALARLDACGRLEWSGVGHLLIYRVREVAAQAAD